MLHRAAVTWRRWGGLNKRVQMEVADRRRDSASSVGRKEEGGAQGDIFR